MSTTDRWRPPASTAQKLGMGVEPTGPFQSRQLQEDPALCHIVAVLEIRRALTGLLSTLPGFPALR